MFGAIVGAMLIVYTVLAVAMVIALPIVVVTRIRRGMEEDTAQQAPQPRPLEANPFVEDQLEVERQRRRVDLRLDAEAAARTHDQVLEDWVTHLQDEQMTAAPTGAASAVVPAGVDPAVQNRLLDALDAAQSDRVDPADPGLDHYSVGLYATRVRELEAAWSAYRRAVDGR